MSKRGRNVLDRVLPYVSFHEPGARHPREHSNAQGLPRDLTHMRRHSGESSGMLHTYLVAADIKLGTQVPQLPPIKQLAVPVQ